MIETDIGLFERVDQAEAFREAMVKEGFESIVVIERHGLFAVVAQVDEPDRLVEVAKGYEPEGAIGCPSCQGRMVSYPARPQASPTAAGLQKVVDAVGGAVGNDQHAHCQTCGYEWVPGEAS